ncbi:MAG: hypothetical protein LC674_00095 [Actinobacteria bacterium]|nr:hypothetical protein [Actinomycetota bacterium]
MSHPPAGQGPIHPATTPADAWHWHGAAPDHFMTHLSITEAVAGRSDPRPRGGRARHRGGVQRSLIRRVPLHPREALTSEARSTLPRPCGQQGERVAKYLDRAPKPEHEGDVVHLAICGGFLFLAANRDGHRTVDACP